MPRTDATSRDDLAAVIRHRLFVAPLELDAGIAPGVATRNPDLVRAWAAHGRELALLVSPDSGVIVRTVAATDVPDHETPRGPDDPAWLTDPHWGITTTAVDLFDEGRPIARVYLYTRPRGAYVPPGVRALGFAEPELIPLPPAERSRWVRPLDKIRCWPWHHAAEIRLENGVRA